MRDKEARDRMVQDGQKRKDLLAQHDAERRRQIEVKAKEKEAIK